MAWLICSISSSNKTTVVEETLSAEIKVKSEEIHQETKYEYHWGYNLMNGKYDWHWGMNTETICDKSALDTIEVNKEKKYYSKK